MTDTLNIPAHHRLYGRAKGKPLTAYQAGLMETVLPQFAISENPTEGHARVYLEIGFGAAEHVLHLARTHPDTLILGAEPFLNGVAKACAAIDAEGITNLRLHGSDVRDILSRLPDASLDRLYILFPDPWPKSRHRKRRLIQEDTIAEFARLLKPGGEWHFASDITDYVDWVLTRTARSPDFTWHPTTAQDFLAYPTDWPGTKYEKKAVKEGRTPHFFVFTRR
jgi:tRNA (guanine-N7-)-methyltransferase